MQLIAVATAALLVAAPVVQAQKAYVYNQCSFPVYLWSVSADSSSGMITLESGSGTYNETYKTPSVGGVSIKLSKTDSCADPTPITQFEYTLAGGDIWYDISNVNCVTTSCPFSAGGMYMASGEGCPTRSCAAGLAVCAGAYTASNDDQNSLACTGTADINLYLCTSSAPSSKRAVQIEIEAPVHRHQHRHPHWRHTS
ncbi:hypothetical protein K432DRAFT_412928 [Lepidopterella palustris CBS 459.81]|uniref:Thaumatin-like protein n=1 Tax=Lepidopterella palustris CBS 459.81 TaxID=1314670 RepID=A0A8E2ELH8_9PEZI|nr:hypothetical protein K432DRAFT_412928 [Lepidopterella palustris CBS 459.81]